MCVCTCVCVCVCVLTGEADEFSACDITTLADRLVGIPSQLSSGWEGGTEEASRAGRNLASHARRTGQTGRQTVGGCDTGGRGRNATSLAAGRCAAVLGLLPGPMRRKGISLTGPTEMLLCYPKGRSIYPRHRCQP